MRVSELLREKRPLACHWVKSSEIPTPLSEPSVYSFAKHPSLLTTCNEQSSIQKMSMASTKWVLWHRSWSIDASCSVICNGYGLSHIGLSRDKESVDLTTEDQKRLRVGDEDGVSGDDPC